MMGPRQEVVAKLFYSGINLSGRIPADHLLRRVAGALNFGFVRSRVAGCYGYNGQESVDPIVLIKLMLLLFLEQVPSERKLMESLRYRLDCMWFCGFDFDASIPDHSVLSKARALWGLDVFLDVFTDLFVRVLHQCIDAGLVSGDVLHMDSSCIAGNVDVDKLQPVLRLTA